MGDEKTKMYLRMLLMTTIKQMVLTPCLLCKNKQDLLSACYWSVVEIKLNLGTKQDLSN